MICVLMLYTGSSKIKLLINCTNDKLVTLNEILVLNPENVLHNFVT